MAGQRRLDLAHFHAEAVQLHLPIGASQELNRAVRAPPHPIPGPVPSVREPLRRQSRLIQIPPGYPLSTYIQLTIHDLNRRAPNRRPNRHLRIYRMITRNCVTAREGGAFRGSIAVDQRYLTRAVQKPPDMRRRKHVPARQQLLQRSQALQLLIDHRVE